MSSPVAPIPAEAAASPHPEEELLMPRHDQLDWRNAVFWVALAFSSFQVITAASEGSPSAAAAPRSM